VTWEDGELSGPNPDMLAMIRLEAEVMEGRSVAPIPTGPYTTTGHLRDSLSAFWLIKGMVPPEDFLEASGDIPEPPELPEGASTIFAGIFAEASDRRGPRPLQ
jgi:hypothetical protein